MPKTTDAFPTEDEFIPPTADSYLTDEDAEELFDMGEVQKFEPLPVGTFPAVVTDYKKIPAVKESPGVKGKPEKMQITFAVTKGDLLNRTKTEWYDKTGNRAFVTGNMLAALNLPKTEDGLHFRMKRSFFIGRACYIVVGENNYTNKEGKYIENTQIKDVLPADENAIQWAAEYL